MLPLRFAVAAGMVAAFAGATSPAYALTISGTTVKTLPDTAPLRADSRTKNIIYNLDLHAGTTDERFSVSLTPPEFATIGGLDEGQSIDGPLQFTLYGPGTVGQVVSDPAFGALCSTSRDRFHGYATGKAVVDVALPAGANTTLAVRYKTGRRAPWADTDLRLKFAFQQSLVGTYDATSPLFGMATPVTDASNITSTHEVPVLAQGKGSKTGAHLALTTSPRGTYGEGETSARKVARSTKVRISGRLLPALSGKKVRLQWGKPGGSLKTAKQVTTAKGGRFSASLKPPGKGEYELWASYPNQSGTLASDSTSCPIRYNVR